MAGILDSSRFKLFLSLELNVPVKDIDAMDLEVGEDETLSIKLQGSDEDKDDLTFTVLSQPKNGALSGTGANLTYTPKANYIGSDSFTFKANDGVADSNTATISIKVDSVNDKPVVTGQSLSVNEDHVRKIKSGNDFITQHGMSLNSSTV